MTSNRTREWWIHFWLAAFILVVMLPASCVSLVYGIGKEADLRQTRLEDYCRANPAQCDMAREVAAARFAGGKRP